MERQLPKMGWAGALGWGESSPSAKGEPRWGDPGQSNWPICILGSAPLGEGGNRETLPSLLLLFFLTKSSMAPRVPVPGQRGPGPDGRGGEQKRAGIP